MAIWRINRTYRNLQRVQTILNVLLKHGFGQLIRKMGLQKLLPLGKQASALSQDDTVSPLDPLTMPERLRLALEELGPTFIKFGQLLSTRPDIIPENFIIELKKLREDNRPLPYPSILKVIEDSLDQPLKSVFKVLEEIPIATASIGQVHAGVLNNGEDVVVKVRRPGIESIVRNDLDILQTMASVLSHRIEEMASFDPEGLVREFEKTILREMDFTVEAMNMQRFQENLKSESGMKIPNVFWEYSSKSLIVMERLSGVPLENPEDLRVAGHVPRRGRSGSSTTATPPRSGDSGPRSLWRGPLPTAGGGANPSLASAAAMRSRQRQREQRRLAHGLRRQNDSSAR